ncbi:MAG TPA: hypothetical protein VHV26_06530 [Rhizomicrobium sp.]|jgi:hypothetical protein|nr:hypothetical protein [Rhizomicrobium sp.]
MTDKFHLEFSGHPDLNLRVKMKPIQFDFACQGAASLAVSDVRLHFDQIPMHMRIPFLKRRVLAGSIGPFGVHLKPFDVNLRAIGVETRGTIGREETELHLQGTGACKAEVEISGKLPELKRR